MKRQPKKKSGGGSKSKSSPGKGIDIGTSFIGCCERDGRHGSVRFRYERDAFFEIDHGDFTKGMLNKSSVKYIQKGENLYIVGNEALNFANMFHRNTRRPLRTGIISPREKEALPMVELLIRSVAGKPSSQGEIAYYSVPGAPIDKSFNTVYHEKVLKGFLTKLGYSTKPINEGLAVIYSELANEGFTGVGLSFGGGMVNFCLALMSVPIISFSLTKAGDWIDEQAAEATNETATRVCSVKEAGIDLNGNYSGGIEKALSIYYDYLIEYVVENIKKELEKQERIPRFDKPIPVVLSGGSALPKGFADRFRTILKKHKLPLEVGKVQTAPDMMKAVSKGAMVAALGEGAK